MRAVLVPVMLLAFGCVVQSCGGEQASAPALVAMNGEACPVRNAKAIGVTGCDLCTCVEGHWSCSGGDCACSGDISTILGDGCTSCPCKDGKFSCVYQQCDSCPPARTDLSCSEGASWARDPNSGLWCEYAKPCAANFGWTTFVSAAECNPLGCSCDRRPGAPPQPIGCGCPPGGCPTLGEALRDACSGDGIPVIERHGCGKVELSFEGGFTGWISVFDEASGTMIGRAVGSDTPFGLCNTFGYTFGEEFACTDVLSECAHCALPTLPPAVPACE
jgi:hypothetical protein